MFGDAYLDGLLVDADTVFWSRPAIAGVLAAGTIEPGAELRMLRAIQHAHLGGLAIAAGYGWASTGWVGCGLAWGGIAEAACLMQLHVDFYSFRHDGQLPACQDSLVCRSETYPGRILPERSLPLRYVGRRA